MLKLTYFSDYSSNASTDHLITCLIITCLIITITILGLMIIFTVHYMVAYFASKLSLAKTYKWKFRKSDSRSEINFAFRNQGDKKFLYNQSDPTFSFCFTLGIKNRCNMDVSYTLGKGTGSIPFLGASMYIHSGRERFNNGDHEIMVFFKEKD